MWLSNLKKERGKLKDKQEKTGIEQKGRYFLFLWRGKKILVTKAERVGEQTTKQEDRKLEAQSTGSKTKVK